MVVDRSKLEGISLMVQVDFGSDMIASQGAVQGRSSPTPQGCIDHIEPRVDAFYRSIL